MIKILFLIIFIYFSLIQLLQNTNVAFEKMYNFYHSSKKSSVEIISSVLLKFYQLFFYKNDTISFLKLSIYIIIIVIINFFSLAKISEEDEKKHLLPALIEDINIKETEFSDNYENMLNSAESEYNNQHPDYVKTYLTEFRAHPDYPWAIGDSLLIHEDQQTYTYRNDETGQEFNEQEMSEYISNHYPNWKLDRINNALLENKKLKEYFKKNGIDKTYEKYCKDNSFRNEGTPSLNESLYYYDYDESFGLIMFGLLILTVILCIIIEPQLIILAVYILKNKSFKVLIFYAFALVLFKLILPLIIVNLGFIESNLGDLFRSNESNSLLEQIPNTTTAISETNSGIIINSELFIKESTSIILLPALSVHALILILTMTSIFLFQKVPKSIYNYLIDYIYSLKVKKINNILIVIGIILAIIEIFGITN